MTKDEQIAQLEEKLSKTMEHLMDCFSQGTAQWSPGPAGTVIYDHGCLSAYEHAQDFLLAEGLIKPEECSRK